MITAGTVYYNADITGKLWDAPSRGLDLIAPDALDSTEATIEALLARASGDILNGELFAIMFRDKYLFVEELGTWLVYSDGGVYTATEPGEVLRAMTAVVTYLRNHIARLYVTRPDDPRIKQLMAHVTKSSVESRLRGALEIAKAQPGMVVRARELDTDPMLVGLDDGDVLDLRRRSPLPSSPDLLITKRIAVRFDPDARCPLWIKFLERVVPDSEVRALLRRWVGYALTGLVTEQVFLFVHGRGANGKSVFVELLRWLFSDYATVIPTQALMASRRDAGAATPELMALLAARLAIAHETEEGSRFAEALLKLLVGSDAITARQLYGRLVTWLPTHKLIIVGNHQPVISGTDHGIWRRVLLVPFEVTIPESERDPRLLEKLKSEGSGILNWALDGLVEFERLGGLQPPRAVLDAVQEYRDSCDVFGQWLDECTALSAGQFTKTTTLYACYTSWAKASGWHPLTRQSFSRRLTDRGFHIGNHGGRAERAKCAEGVVLNDEGTRRLLANPDR